MVVRVLALAAALTILTAVGALGVPHFGDSLEPTRWWVVPLVAFAFAVAERTVFHLEFRREAISFSLSEVPTAFALLYLAPGPAIGARVVGSMIAIAYARRSKWYKLVFNATLFAAETVVAYAVARFVVELGNGSQAVTLLALIPATGLATIIGSLMVSAVISFVEGSFRKRAMGELRVSSWVAPMNAVVAATVVAPAMIDPWLVLMSLIPLVAVWGIMRSRGNLEQRFRDLTDLHGFVGRVGRSLDLGEVVLAAASEVASLLRVGRVGIVVFTEHDEPVRHDIGEPLPALPHASDDPLWAAVFATSTAVEPPGITGALAIAVRDGEGIVGLIVAAGREGAQMRFRPTDEVRLATLAEQFTPNVRKATLHQQIDFEARHDALTGLPNRSQFERLVNAALRHHPISDEVQPVIMLMDLDRFKEVNDTLGHHAGDAVLVTFAQRLSNTIGPGDLLARLAGDEFALLAMRDIAGVNELAKRLVSEIRQPFTIDGVEVVVTMSIGVAPATPPAVDASSLLRRADIAMYTAKNRHTGFEHYRDDIDRRTPARLAMLGDLRNALEDGDLQVFLQPKLDIASGVVIGVEALARWAHPNRGWVSPDDFVHVAEETGLIKQMTDHVLDVAVTQLQRLRSLGHHLGLAVNLSTHDLLDDLLPERVMRQLERRDVDPTLLTLEITESSLLIDAPRARATIDRLNGYGVRLSVDDFGTGYSSLSYLRHLPVSELKIDHSFVAQVLFDEQDEVIVRSIIELGHNLGMQVVAEGVETDEVLTRLRGFSCDVAQGFGICRPVPLDQFIAWLNTTHHPSRRTDPMSPERWPLDN
ncbi:MAG: EAL domain-containing protein [Actinomycetota bacterium]|nr:EAL domain-containing protein [Actinomycetota bacterium]